MSGTINEGECHSWIQFYSESGSGRIPARDAKKETSERVPSRAKWS